MIPIAKPLIGATEKRAVMEVLESGHLVQGARVARLEEMFAQLCNTGHAIAVSSGTDALHLALLAHGIGPGDEVITIPFTFIASVNSIIYTGARPVLVDIEAETFNIDPKLVQQAITPRTKAILPVHLFGYPCDLDELMNAAWPRKILVIEDCAQAVGATYRGRPVGSSNTGCFSLYATKNIMSVEGGIITTNDDAIAERARLLRNHGMKYRYRHELLGFNSRMSDVHAAIGVAQMRRLDEFTTKRRANAAFLNANLKTVITPRAKNDRCHVWHQYTIRLDRGRDRDDAVQQLKETGIETGVFYPTPAHKEWHIRKIVGDLYLPVAERLAREVISLPVHPSLTQEDLETIVIEVNKL